MKFDVVCFHSSMFDVLVVCRLKLPRKAHELKVAGTNDDVGVRRGRHGSL